MKILLSPSKSMMQQPEPSGLVHTQPLFADQTNELLAYMRTLSEQQVAKIIDVSASLAKLNYQRFQQWDETPRRAALWLYAGDVYNGVDAYSMGDDTQRRAQERLLIVSGLYGLLRPFDAIQPYRLEMKLPIKTKQADSLYAFWRPVFTDYFSRATDDVVLLCASNEYAKAVRPCLPARVHAITPRFMQETADGLKEKGLFAKYARGALARWVLDNEITDPADLKRYENDGFYYAEHLSADDEIVYIIPKDFSLKGRFTKK